MPFAAHGAISATRQEGKDCRYDILFNSQLSDEDAISITPVPFEEVYGPFVMIFVSCFHFHCSFFSNIPSGFLFSSVGNLFLLSTHLFAYITTAYFLKLHRPLKIEAKRCFFVCFVLNVPSSNLCLVNVPSSNLCRISLRNVCSSMPFGRKWKIFAMVSPFSFVLLLSVLPLWPCHRQTN